MTILKTITPVLAGAALNLAAMLAIPGPTQAEDAKLARWQHRLEPVWKRIAGGCHLTRNVEDLLPGAGFAVTEQDVLAPPKTGPFKPFRVGVAA